MKGYFSKPVNKKGIAIIAVCLALALALIFFPEGETQITHGGDSAEIELESYTAMLEEKIRTICSAVDGVTEPVVLITLESGTEHIYADNRREETEADGSVSYTSDYLILDRGDGSEPLLVREVCPQVRGVAVVLRGGDSPTMRKKLTELLSASLGISSSRIMVTG